MTMRLKISHIASRVQLPQPWHSDIPPYRTARDVMVSRRLLVTSLAGGLLQSLQVGALESKQGDSARFNN